jgi:hypothetical protein
MCSLGKWKLLMDDEFFVRVVEALVEHAQPCISGCLLSKQTCRQYFSF